MFWEMTEQLQAAESKLLEAAHEEDSFLSALCTLEHEDARSLCHTLCADMNSTMSFLPHGTVSSQTLIQDS